VVIEVYYFIISQESMGESGLVDKKTN